MNLDPTSFVLGVIAGLLMALLNAALYQRRLRARISKAFGGGRASVVDMSPEPDL